MSDEMNLKGDGASGPWSVNPLLAALPPAVCYEDLPALLAHEPLSSISLEGLPLQRRAEYLSKIGSHFVPTSAAIDIADAVLTAIRSGYEDRDPSSRAFKQERYNVGAWSAQDGVLIRSASVRNARGITIKGMTGVGKSTIVARTLSLLPQVIDHGFNEQCGWAAQKQLVWLRVDMTSDGSRLGFLMQIYREVDAALGTNYFAQYASKKMTVETHMVAVSKILFNCFCGVLVIEEIQFRNFGTAAARDLMLLFFLRLANLGVPIVLIGNPQGFDGFDVFSQDVRRMSSGGSFELWPAESQSDVDWGEFVVPGMLRFTVLPRPPNVEHASALLFDCTGGVLDFLAKVLTQAQLLAIRMGRDQITGSEIVAAYHSPVLRPLHSLIRGLVERKVDQLRSFEDVPVELLAEWWARARDHRETELHPEGSGRARASMQGKSREATGGTRTHYQQGAARYKAKITAGKRRDNRAKELEANLSPEDIRANGRKEALLGNFSLMQWDINRKKQ
ncbi:ATP-binding protein [Paraburkholderia fynbosensis]|uniref:ORC1/DEAH AAA+ ATPase domain-containing protein n=1 Tax=Paraburkholderia fynbosensis TaxID=1200993 RepID=A0A6J5FKM7_9BURK|nr:ATP-binding protein [Paraburkholderia fynbosensis]CAB3780341.1 hypothetical protein LMG27177_00899 [Paraburkholderia fynbosensis]